MKVKTQFGVYGQMIITTAISARKRGHLVRRMAVSVAALALLAGSAIAAPQGAQVAAGTATIQQSGATTTITASHNSIINYSSFNLASNETVQFIQPSATSRVLNRIAGDAPTVIDGRLFANGEVFFVNRAGIFFGPNSVINVGQIYAAAGNISDRDFQQNRLNFTSLRGSVINEGRIEARGVTMLGESVANRGMIVGLESSLIMAAGENVYIRENPRGGVVVRISGASDGAAGSQGDKGYGVSNTGTINTGGGRVSMMAGDVYSLAIRNTGNVTARDVQIDGGANGRVDISGTVNASSTRSGETGGRVTISGQTVVVDHAQIHADGAAGGGEVQIGGGFRGQGETRQSDVTLISRDSTVTANATESGNGGRIAVWSNAWTWFGGNLAARGAAGGNGGFAEISSAGSLGFNAASVNLSGGGPETLFGTLLLDPTSITMQDGAGGFDGNLPTINGTDGIGAQTVSYAAVNTALATSSVLLEATTSITFDTIGANTFNFTNLTSAPARTLTFRTTGAGGSISFTTPTNTITGQGGAMIFTTGTGGASLGNINTNNGVLTITATGGAVSLTSGSTGTADFNSTGVAFTGAVSTGSGNITLTHTGLVTINGTGLVTTGGNISTAGANFSQAAGSLSSGAGSILLRHIGTVTSSRPITTTGTLRIAAAGGISLTGAVSATNAALINTTAGNIVASGGNTIGTLAASNTFAGGSIEVNHTGASTLTVGTVAALTGFNSNNALVGLTTSSGPITLVNSGGGLALNDAVNLGTAGASVLRLSSVNGISQTAAITAGSLGATNATAGNINLQNAANTVASVALSNTFATGQANFVTSGGLTVTQVPAAALTLAFGSVTGVTSTGAGSILLTTGTGAGNALVLNQPVNASATGTARLQATGGINQAAAGLVTAGTLGLVNSSSGNIVLDQANVLGTVAASNSVTAGTIELNSSPGAATALNVGTVGLLAGFNGGVALTGITATSGPITLVNTNGSITIGSAVSTGAGAAGVLRLSSTNGVSQTAGITANTLAVLNSTAGDINLQNVNNSVANVAMNNSFATGQANLFAGSALTVTQVPAAALTLAFGSVTGVTTAGAGSIFLLTSNTAANLALTLNQPVNATAAGTVRLGSSSTITQNATGLISAGTLGLVTQTAGGSNSITLPQANVVNTLASRVTGTNRALEFNSTVPLTIGSVAAGPATFNAGAALNGLSMAGPSATILVISGAGGSAMAINQAITASGSVRLQSASGMSQVAAGIISTGELSLVNTTAGNIALDGATSAVSSLSARNTFAGGSISFLDGDGLNIVATTGNPANFNGGTNVTGISTNAGNVFVSTTDGGGGGSLLDVQAAILATGALVRLQSEGGMSQTAAGTITAGTLGAVNLTAGDIVLENAANAFANIAASNATTGGLISLRSGGPITVSNLALLAGFNGGAALNGVSGAGAHSIAIYSGTGGALAVNDVVNATAAGTVRLASQGGISQNAGGIITASTLGVTNATAGNIDLLSANNAVTTFAGANNFATGQVNFFSTQGLTIGTLTNAVALFNGGVNLVGVTTTGNGDVLLRTNAAAGALAINQAVNAGSGGTVRLLSSFGMTQTAGITAGNLGAINIASGSITLTNATNDVQTFAASATNAGGVVNFVSNSATSLTIGQIAGNPAVFNGGADLNGVTTNAGNAVLQARIGSMAINQPVNVGAANGIRLDATGGITQAAAGILTANTLGAANFNVSGGLAPTGAITLDQANAITTFAGRNDTPAATGSLTFRSTGPLTVGSVASIGGSNGAAALNGAVTNAADVAVRSDGTLSITQAITAPGSIVRLISNGNLTQSGAGIITANGLGAVNRSAAAGNITLTLANLLTPAGATDATFAAFNANTNANTTRFVNDGAFSVGTVTAISGFFGTPAPLTANVVGIDTAAGNGDVTLVSNNAGLQIDQALNAGTGIVRLSVAGNNTGGVNALGQSATGIIIASGLGIANGATSNVVLDQANLIDAFAATSDGLGAGVTLRSSRNGALAVGSIAAGPAEFNGGAAVVGLTTSNGDANIISDVGGLVSVNQPINVGNASSVRIASLGGVGQNATGIITAANLGVANTTAGNIDLTGASNVVSGIFASSNTFATGTIGLLSTSSYSSGTVPNTLALFNGGANLVGVTSSNADITLVSTTGGLQLDQAVNAGTGVVRLQVAGLNGGGVSSISQAATGLITASGLGLRNTSTASILLDQANLIDVLGARSTGAAAEVAVRNSRNGALSVGTIAAGPAVFNGGLAINGVTTNAADATIVSDVGGVLSVDQPINVGNANSIRLGSQGGITQAVAGILTAQSVGVTNGTAGNIDLTTANNAFNIFAANSTFSGGNVSARTNLGLTVGTVNNAVAFFNGGANLVGVTTAGNGNLLLVTTAVAAGLAVNAPVNTGTGAVRLGSSFGMSQGGAGAITAGLLAIANAANGDVLLDSATNNVATLAVSNGGAGGVVSFNGGTTALTIGQATGNSAIFNGSADINGITTNAGNTTIVNGASIAVNQPVNVGAANIVRLGGVGGVTQNNTGIITATSLGLVNSGTGNITITAANAVTTFAASNTAPAGNLSISGNAVTIGQVAADPGFNAGNALVGTSALGTTTLASTGAAQNFTINENVTSGSFDFTAGAGGNIVIGGAGTRVITATGQQVLFRSPVLLNQNTTVTATGSNVNFMSSIDSDAGNRNLSVFSTFTPTFVTGSPGSTIPSIIFGGNIGQTNPLGTLTLGGTAGGPRAGVPEYATIVFAANHAADGSVPSNVALTPFTVRTANFTMQRNEKLTSFGNLTLNTTTANTVGDLAIVGDLTFAGAGTLTILERNASSLRVASGNVISADSGVDVVANHIINAPALLVSPLVGAPAAASDQFIIQRISTLDNSTQFGGVAKTNRQFTTALAVPQFVNGAFAMPLDLDAQGRTATDPSSAIAGVVAEESVQRTDPAQTISASVKKFLEELKIEVREADAADLVNFLNGLSYIDDSGSLSGSSLSSAGSGIATRRFSVPRVKELSAEYQELATAQVPVTDADGKPAIGSDGKPLMQERQDRIRVLFDRAYEEFDAQAGNAEKTPALFESFLATSPKHAEAYASLKKIRVFLGNLESVGLTRYELLAPRAALLNKFTSGNTFNFEFFSELVGKPTMQTAAK